MRARQGGRKRPAAARAASSSSGASCASAPARGERIAIEDGLRAGERVVTAGQIKLQAYMPVTLDETRRASDPRRDGPAVTERR